MHSCIMLPGSLQLQGRVGNLSPLQRAVVLAGLPCVRHRQDSLSERLESPPRSRWHCRKRGAEHRMDHLRAACVPLHIRTARKRRRSSSGREARSSGTAESLVRCCGQRLLLLALGRNQAPSSPRLQNRDVILLRPIIPVVLHGSSVQRDVAEE